MKKKSSKSSKDPSLTNEKDRLYHHSSSNGTKKNVSDNYHTSETTTEPIEFKSLFNVKSKDNKFGSILETICDSQEKPYCSQDNVVINSHNDIDDKGEVINSTNDHNINDKKNNRSRKDNVRDKR